MNAEPVLKMSVRLAVVSVICFAFAALPDWAALLQWVVIVVVLVAVPIIMIQMVRETNAARKQAMGHQRSQGQTMGQAHRSYVPHSSQTGKYAGYQKRVI